MNIAILSPHLDDAVLSCSDHIREWLSQKKTVVIITLFTSFQSKNPSKDALEYINLCHCSALREFEKMRKKEDRHAMSMLNGIKWKYLHYMDGGFREYNRKPVYSSFTDLFSGEISTYDASLISLIKKNFAEFPIYDEIVSPLGIGNHADHLITRTVAEHIFPKNTLRFYVDFPYALKRKKWKKKDISLLIQNKKSIKLPSQKKKEILHSYTSQLPLLFENSLWYPEIIIR